MNIDILKEAADILKALGHPVRLCIARGLLGKPSNVSQMVECTQIGQANVSQHLNVLKAAGIVKGQRKGTQIRYSLCSPIAQKILRTLPKTEES